MLTIKFSTSNAAFHDDDYDNIAIANECARILKVTASKIQDGYTEGKCIDYNGNVVGEWKLK